MIETLPAMNKRLIDDFGLFEDGRPNFRIVWSEDQIEKRKVWQTDEGFHLLSPQVKEVKKYPYLPNTYLLERLFGVDENNFSDLVTKTSYECIWAFRTDLGEPVQPVYKFVKLLVETLLENEKRARDTNEPPKYVMPELEKQTPEAIEQRIKIIQEQLYGNETEVGDALHLDEAVGYGPRQRSESKNIKIN
jgi:hypothetical protein